MSVLKILFQKHETWTLVFKCRKVLRLICYFLFSSNKAGLVNDKNYIPIFLNTCFSINNAGTHFFSGVQTVVQLYSIFSHSSCLTSVYAFWVFLTYTKLPVWKKNLIEKFKYILFYILFYWNFYQLKYIENVLWKWDLS